MITDRIPPQSLEVERIVLGTCLIERTAADLVVEKCTEDFFYSWANKKIFSTIKTMVSANQTIDIVLLAEQLKSAKIIDGVGGEAYLAELSETICTVGNLQNYIDTLKNKYILRTLVTIGTEILNKAFDAEADPEEIIQTAEQTFLDISTDKEDAGFKKASEILPGTFEDIEKRSSGTVIGVPTGFTDLDKFIGGMEKSDLIIIAGRPSMGKTSYAISIALNCAKIGKTVALFSLEMNKNQIMMRMLSHDAGINILSLRTGTLPKRDYPRLSLAAGPISEANIFIDDYPNATVQSILSKSRRLKRASGLDLIIIDYLQLMNGKGENRQQEITTISRGLKQAAKFLDVPVIALSQLSRDLEKRTDKRPQLSDLRESGAIEQDADVVLFVYRDEVYNPSPENAGKAEIIIGKQRNGPIGTIPLSFSKDCARFNNYTNQTAQEGEGTWQDRY